MLVLRRFVGESIVIAGEVKIEIIAVKGKNKKQVIVGVTAPKDCEVDRLEVWEAKQKGEDA